MENVSFEEIVRAWLLSYDDRIPFDKADRREAFGVLLEHLKLHSYSKDDLSTSRKEKIVRSCVNPYHKDRNKLKKWISIVVNDLDAAVLLCYGYLPINKDILEPELREKLRSVPVSEPRKEGVESEGAVGDEGSKPLNLDGEPVSLEEDSIDISSDKVKTDPKVVDATDEMLDSMDGPEPVWDEELMNDLGVSFDE